MACIHHCAPYVCERLELRSSWLDICIPQNHKQMVELHCVSLNVFVKHFSFFLGSNNSGLDTEISAVFDACEQCASEAQQGVLQHNCSLGADMRKSALLCAMICELLIDTDEVPHTNTENI